MLYQIVGAAMYFFSMVIASLVVLLYIDIDKFTKNLSTLSHEIDNELIRKYDLPTLVMAKKKSGSQSSYKLFNHDIWCCWILLLCELTILIAICFLLEVRDETGMSNEFNMYPFCLMVLFVFMHVVSKNVLHKKEEVYVGQKKTKILTKFIR